MTEYIVQCPTCPVCGGDPMPMALALAQCFCANDGCNVLAWDPYRSLEENLTNAGQAKITGTWPGD